MFWLGELSLALAHLTADQAASDSTKNSARLGAIALRTGGKRNRNDDSRQNDLC